MVKSPISRCRCEFCRWILAKEVNFEQKIIFPQRENFSAASGSSSPKWPHLGPILSGRRSRLQGLRGKESHMHGRPGWQLSADPSLDGWGLSPLHIGGGILRRDASERGLARSSREGWLCSRESSRTSNLSTVAQSWPILGKDAKFVSSFKICFKAFLMNFSIMCGINQNGSEFSIEWYVTQQDWAVTCGVIKV